MNVQVQDLNAMTIAALKEYYASLTNPVAIEGDKRRKENWINAILESGDRTEEKQEIIPDDEIPFYELYSEEELKEIEKEAYEREYGKEKSEVKIFGVPISFGKTLPQLLSGNKSVTRRTWSDNYARMFINAYKQGKLIQAFDKDRRYGGKLIGYLKVSNIHKEGLLDMPDSDVECEGFPELSKRQFLERFFDKHNVTWDKINKPPMVFVIRFKFIPLESTGDRSHHESLEKCGFRFLGDAKRMTFLDEPQCFVDEIGQWKIYSIVSLRAKPSRQILTIYLSNPLISESWQKDYCPNGESTKSFINGAYLNAKQCVLEMIYSKGIKEVHHA